MGGRISWRALGARTGVEQGTQPGFPFATADGGPVEDFPASCVRRTAPIPDLVQAPATTQADFVLVQAAVPDTGRWQGPFHVQRIIRKNAR
jgi:hypothetical protein